MPESGVAFRNRHISHLKFSRALAQRLSVLILLLTVALTTAAFAGSNYDGPAELPRMVVLSAMVATPAPGSIIAVNAGGNLQSALDNARCGDVIELQAGATFTGPFLVPAKNCDSNHWIWSAPVLRTALCPQKGSAPRPAMPGSLLSRGARNIAAPIPST